MTVLTTDQHIKTVFTQRWKQKELLKQFQEYKLQNMVSKNKVEKYLPTYIKMQIVAYL